MNPYDQPHPPQSGAEAQTQLPIKPHDPVPTQSDNRSFGDMAKQSSQSYGGRYYDSNSACGATRDQVYEGSAPPYEPGHPYVTSEPAPKPKSTVDSMKVVLGKWGKKAADSTKKTQTLAGNMWQHMKTAPSLTDAAVGRIAQGTKMLAEGGYDNIFKQNFELLPEEKLVKTYACYLSTSMGPIMGVLYLSTAKLAFCSDNPLSYKVGQRDEYSYYKVAIPLQKLKTVNPSTSTTKPSEKYIQVSSVDNHEFWFMAFVHYESAIKALQAALLPLTS